MFYRMYVNQNVQCAQDEQDMMIILELLNLSVLCLSHGRKCRGNPSERR